MRPAGQLSAAPKSGALADRPRLSSQVWIDALVFYFIGHNAWPLMAASLRIGHRLYFFNEAILGCAGAVFSLELVPEHIANRWSLFAAIVFQVSFSAAVFLLIDKSKSDSIIKERQQERYVAALSHDFGTPISALQMAMKQIVALISPTEHEQLLPLLEGANSCTLSSSLASLHFHLLPLGMHAALDLMTALKRKAIDIGKRQHGQMLTPERSAVDLRDIVLTKLPALIKYMPKQARIPLILARRTHMTPPYAAATVRRRWRSSATYPTTSRT